MTTGRRFGAWVWVIGVVALGIVSCSESKERPPATDGGTDAAPGSCKTDSDCVSQVPQTTPANCAVGTCNKKKGVCVFTAKDADGDGHLAANCTANDGTPIKTGDDCDDGDKNLYPGHPESCSLGADGGTPAGMVCTQGKYTCNADGSRSACTGMVACAAEQACDVTGSTVTCKAGCEIDGVFYQPDDPAPKDPCQTCQPSVSTSSWTTLADGTPCGNGQLCGSGQCGAQCNIGGTTYPTGGVNPNNPCQSCQPGTSTTSWTTDSGASCGMGMVCNGLTCAAGCYVSGSFYQPDQTNPVDSCQKCQPAVSANAWTTIAGSDGTTCGNGQVCIGGMCVKGCYIGSTSYSSGQVNPANGCQSCQPSVSTTAWTDVAGAQGATCANGKVCMEGACIAGCNIGGAYVAPGAVNPKNSCQSCQPGTSTTAWTNAADGACGAAGDQCCGGTCIDPRTDPNACGGCGTVCNAGPSPGCSSGWCNYTLASGQSGPQGVAVDVTSVYWTDEPGGTVVKVLLGGGTPTTLVSGQNGPYGIAVDATSVYFTDKSGGTVMKVPLDGGSPATLASGQTNPQGIAVDATNVYWVDGGSGSSDGLVMELPLGGGAAATTLVSGQNGPQGIAVDATSVYWTNGGGTVMQVPLGGGAPTALASGQTNPQGIAVDATSVYWVDGGSGSSDGLVMQVPLGGGTANTLASGQNGPYGIALDAASVYWTNGGGTVMKVPLGGGTPTTLASGQTNPQGIAVDAKSVYWASGSVMKAPK